MKMKMKMKMKTRLPKLLQHHPLPHILESTESRNYTINYMELAGVQKRSRN
jgi:hypothetical protein